MAKILDAQTTNTTTSGTTFTGKVVVYATGVFDGALAQVQIAPTDTAAEYEPIDGGAADFNKPGQIVIGAEGAYYLRAIQSDSGTKTEITINVVQ